MVILYIYSTYWCMKSVFYERQQTLVPFNAGGIRGELPIGGLDADILLGVLSPFILATLVAYS
jgi:hypothetical protein